MKRYLLAAVVFVGGCVTPEQAALNVRNARLGQELAANTDPAVSAPGAEIAENSMALGESAFRGVTPSQIPTTPEQSAALRVQVVESASLWDRVKQGAAGLLGGIPGLGPILGALGGAGAVGGLLLRLVGKWRGIATATIQGVETLADANPGFAGQIKATIAAAHEDAGVAAAALKAVATVTGKPTGV